MLGKEYYFYEAYIIYECKKSKIIEYDALALFQKFDSYFII